MRTLPALLLVLSSFTSSMALADGHPRQRHHDDGPRMAFAEERIERLLDRQSRLGRELDARMERLERLLGEGDQGALRAAWGVSRDVRELRRELAQVQARIDHLVRERLAAFDAPPPPPMPRALADGELRVVLDALAHEPFSDGKHALLQDVARRSYFTVEQVRAVMDQFAFGDDKVDAAALLYGRTLDHDRWFLVYQGLTFSSEKDELRRRTG